MNKENLELTKKKKKKGIGFEMPVIGTDQSLGLQ
jgi:hypothetical protein